MMISAIRECLKLIQPLIFVGADPGQISSLGGSPESPDGEGESDCLGA